jgi:hypothetical protein
MVVGAKEERNGRGASEEGREGRIEGGGRVREERNGRGVSERGCREGRIEGKGV